MGHLAVQIAHHLGAEVIATAAEGDLEFVRGLGADRALDYRATDIRAEVHDVDAALVPFAGTTRVDSMYTVRQGGTVVTLLGTEPDGPEIRIAAERGLYYSTTQVYCDQAAMRSIAEMARSGALRARIGRTLPLAICPYRSFEVP